MEERQAGEAIYQDMCRCDTLRKQSSEASAAAEMVYNAEIEKHRGFSGSISARYAIFSTLNLLELINTIGGLCKCCTLKQEYRGRLHATKIEHVGTTLEVLLTCDHGHTLSWTSSAQAGKRYEINCALPAAWEMCGLEITKYNAFCDAFGLHCISRSTWMRTVEEFGHLVAQPREAQVIATRTSKK